ncbi:hypothetical protein BDV97DRAFT_357205 [Delphinella strobiligena]|nr:hypothetical protein BDV97DRAFT_357205 [Delphinella strobiligena]
MPTVNRRQAKILDPLAAFDRSVLEEKSVIITGGASGLGEAFAHEFVKAGAFVTIGDVNETNGRRVVTDLGSNAQFIKCDVTSWTDQLAMFKLAIAHSPHRSCDIVCANAGIIGEDGLWIADDTDDPHEPDLSIVKVQTIGTLYTTKLAMHYFRKQPNTLERDRCLILTGSLSGYVGHVGNPQYSMGKWGIRSLMRCFRETCGDDGIRINLLAPFFIATPLLPEPFLEHLESNGLKLAAIPDAAEAVIQLASDSTLNGCGIAVVSRSISEKGYFDLQDEPHSDFLNMLQEEVTRIRVQEA